jgi:hypothetical protein
MYKIGFPYDLTSIGYVHKKKSRYAAAKLRQPMK